jgi:UDP-glucose 4-epimerase
LNGEVTNIGSGKGISIKNLLKEIEKIYNEKEIDKN